jgi:hypothetical protein
MTVACRANGKRLRQTGEMQAGASAQEQPTREKIKRDGLHKNVSMALWKENPNSEM